MFVKRFFIRFQAACTTPNIDFARFTQRSGHVPSGNLDYVIETLYFDWCWLDLRRARSYLAFVVRPCCPDSSIN
jgi:hypothetical protein